MGCAPQLPPGGSGHKECNLPFSAVTSPCTSRNISARESSCPRKLFIRERKSYKIQNRYAKVWLRLICCKFTLFLGHQEVASESHVILRRLCWPEITWSFMGRGKLLKQLWLLLTLLGVAWPKWHQRWVSDQQEGQTLWWKSVEKRVLSQGRNESKPCHYKAKSSCYPLAHCFVEDIAYVFSLWGWFLFNVTKMCFLERARILWTFN